MPLWTVLKYQYHSTCSKRKGIFNVISFKILIHQKRYLILNDKKYIYVYIHKKN